MIKFPEKYLHASVICLLSIAVNSLNYVSHPSYPSSAPSTISETTTDVGTNRTSTVKSGRKFESPITIYYPLTSPQRRGGKNLNLTLVKETSRSQNEQSRILNKPDWYQNNSVSAQSFKKVPSISPNPSLLQDNSYKWIAPLDKNTHITSDNIPFNHAPKILSIKDIGSFYSPQRVRETDIVQQNFGQVLPFPAPQKLRTFTDVPISYILRNNNYNSNYRQTLPPKLHQATSSSYYFPPPRHETNANWPCFCVPYYLCKNGVINSGGRSVAALRRRTRSLEYGTRNTTQYPVLVQPAYIVEQDSDQSQCDGQKVCCRMSFADDVPYNNDDNYYPVATPRPHLPERYYPLPPRFSNREREQQTCGIRRAYGIQARLRHLQYPADVSEFGEYPWQIAILRKTEGQKSLYLCGGVLISYQWVATAAHCVKNEQYSPLLIRLGEWDVNRRDEIYPFVEIEVDSIIVHSEFNPETLYNDLALIRMITPVDPRLPHVTPICLPDHETLYNEQRCWVSGWGKDFFGPQGEYQSVLKEVDVPVIMQDICSSELRKTHLGPNFHLHPGFLCAGGEPGKDACTGDGGSPLVCRSGQHWYVVGLVSWGIGCGQPGIPGIYVNILYYIDWINSIVGR